ncbi:hypothetical protein [Azospirillum sp. ST 5-10]|uniref:hypothetical protein n=1 Tax=unclassified Azospirillum TaxID=2630922 RepID=UPI003F4A1B81
MDATHLTGTAPAAGEGRRRRAAVLCWAAALVVFAVPAHAQEIGDDLLASFRTLVTKPVVLIALRAQNERHAALDQATIDALDARWRQEAKAAEQPLIAQLMGSPLSNYLIKVKAESNGLITEAFVIDNRGLNVGQSSVTSDYWQGDEAKFQKTFLAGPDAVNHGDVEVSGETGTRRQQVDFTIVDPDTGRPVGAATFEVDLDELAERRSKQPKS